MEAVCNNVLSGVKYVTNDSYDIVIYPNPVSSGDMAYNNVPPGRNYKASLYYETGALVKYMYEEVKNNIIFVATSGADNGN